VPSTSPTSTVPPTASPTPEGVLRPAVEPRLVIPLRAAGWTLVGEDELGLDLVHLLEDVGDGGFNVAASVYEPHGVYDPVDETRRLPLPDDLMAWLETHPDLDADPPVDRTVAGHPARSIDALVTYEPGPRGQTAQFIDFGGGSRNLEAPSRLRIVEVELPDRPLLIVYTARPELFDEGIDAFERLLSRLEYGEAPS
jgi:hypothetical protein